MTPLEVAARLEHFAGRVRSIRPVCHANPERFFEDRSEVIAELMAEARQLRTVTIAPTRRPIIVPGPREIGGRTVRVEVRQRA